MVLTIWRITQFRRISVIQCSNLNRLYTMELCITKIAPCIGDSIAPLTIIYKEGKNLVNVRCFPTICILCIYIRMFHNGIEMLRNDFQYYWLKSESDVWLNIYNIHNETHQVSTFALKVCLHLCTYISAWFIHDWLWINHNLCVCVCVRGWCGVRACTKVNSQSTSDGSLEGPCFRFPCQVSPFLEYAKFWYISY